jgi:hypothetical protein
MAALKLVRVLWEDASVADSDTWVQRADLPAPDVVVFDQVGWLFDLTAEHVVLSDCVGVDLIGPRTRIPAGMVKSIVEYEPTNAAPLAIPKKKRKKT